MKTRRRGPPEGWLEKNRLTRPSVGANIGPNRKNNERDPQFERTVLIKFIFEDDELISWEEDNITLNMAHQTRPGTVLIKYVNLLINLILLVAVFGG